ncbi:MAG: methyltransferase domain-containing protein [Anaerolineae bacterium]|jgi:ubiquinone/menaquinone biosynthesis C-methylase UbiE|nr:methyltransferase domain-containing protein [Anaerolineae bacterium]
MRILWRRLIAFGFRLLYNELAWLYDPVSWLASMGLWRRWQRTALEFLPAPGARVLELGIGPGHLLAELAARGYRAAGLDLSRAMVRRAGRRVRRLGLPGAVVCRGRAGALPFAAGSFDAALATFPTAYIADPASLHGLAWVLRPGGRLIVVEEAVLSRRGLVSRLLEWLYRITGQRGPGAPGLAARLEAAGFRAWRETLPVEGTAVRLVLAETPGE